MQMQFVQLRVGHKQSGYGYHSGVDGFHQFSIPKTLVFHEVSTTKLEKIKCAARLKSSCFVHFFCVVNSCNDAKSSRINIVRCLTSSPSIVFKRHLSETVSFVWWTSITFETHLPTSSDHIYIYCKHQSTLDLNYKASSANVISSQ